MEILIKKYIVTEKMEDETIRYYGFIKFCYFNFLGFKLWRKFYLNSIFENNGLYFDTSKLCISIFKEYKECKDKLDEEVVKFENEIKTKMIKKTEIKELWLI